MGIIGPPPSRRGCVQPHHPKEMHQGRVSTRASPSRDSSPSPPPCTPTTAVQGGTSKYHRSTPPPRSAMPLPRTPPIHIPTPKARATSPASTTEFPVPDELGELLPSLSQSLDNNGFFETCLSTRGRCELVELESSAHPAAGLVNHLRTHGAPVSTHYTLSEGDLEAAIAYGCHGSATKGAVFARTELAEQVWYGHVVVFPLSKIRDLENLWISLVGIIPQE